MTENTRAAIIRAASTEFAQFGFHGARTARIAQGAGVNKQLLFYYFGAKTGLYAEAVRAASATLRDFQPHDDAPAGGPRPAAERIRSRMARITAMCGRHPQLVRLVLGSSDGPEGAAGIAQSFLQELADDLAGEISGGQGLGFFRDDADPTLVATQALTLVFGFFLFQRPGTAEGHAEHRSHWDLAATDWVIRTLSW